jgi:hypothetical protein
VIQLEPPVPMTPTVCISWGRDYTAQDNKLDGLSYNEANEASEDALLIPKL